MTGLAIAGLAMGAVLVVMAAPCFLAPGKAREAARAFPRNAMLGWLLTTVSLVWAAWLLYNVPLPRLDVFQRIIDLEKMKPSLLVLTPLFIYLVGRFVDELLAARALGGILILIPAPILDAIRWPTNSLRLPVTILCYVLVIEGIVLILSPYLFRRQAERLLATDRSARITGIVGAVLGAALLALSLTVY